MVSRGAHLLCFILASAPAAAACGGGAVGVQVASVKPNGEVALSDGTRARWAGLLLWGGAQSALDALISRRLGVVDLGPRDRWGRRVVDLRDDQGRSLGLDLVERGLARVRPEPEAQSCAAERAEAEAGARAAGEGVWGDAAAVIDASDAQGLAAADGRFVFVAGAVRRVGERGAKVYLDFARAGGFAVVVPRKAEPQFRRAGVDIKTLAGRRVLVRGVLDISFGPRIEVADPAMIELLDGAEE